MFWFLVVGLPGYIIAHYFQEFGVPVVVVNAVGKPYVVGISAAAVSGNTTNNSSSSIVYAREEQDSATLSALLILVMIGFNACWLFLGGFLARWTELKFFGNLLFKSAFFFLAPYLALSPWTSIIAWLLGAHMDWFVSSLRTSTHGILSISCVYTDT